MQWGDKYLQIGGPPLSFVEEKTGRELQVRVTAGSSERSIRSDEIAVRLPRKPRREKPLTDNVSKRGVRRTNPSEF